MRKKFHIKRKLRHGFRHWLLAWSISLRDANWTC